MSAGTSKKRLRSRRRLAAVTFLSNISLDGTHNDTKLGQLKKSGALPSRDSIKNKKVAANKENECTDEETQHTPQRLLKCENIYRNQSIDSGASEATLVPSKDYGSDVTDSTTETPTNLSPQHEEPEQVPGWSEDLCSVAKRKILDKDTHVSSQESIVSSVVGTHVRKYSSSVSESSSSQCTTKEVKFLKTGNEPIHIPSAARMVLFSSGRSPLLVFSSLPYFRGKGTRTDGRVDVRRRHVSGSRPLSIISDGLDPFELMGLQRWEEGSVMSYRHLLEPTQTPNRRMTSEDLDIMRSHPHVTRCYSFDPGLIRSQQSPPVHVHSGASVSYLRSYSSGSIRLPHAMVKPFPTAVTPSSAAGGEADVFNTTTFFPTIPYHSGLFDDEEWSAGSHRTLLSFASYRTSIIDYIKPSELKKELNDKFREKFPHIRITLSKLRSLKREMRKIVINECGLDLLTIAQAFVYFEKLVLQGRIQKANRKLCAGACLLLSAKLNDVKNPNLSTLLEKIELVFRLNRRELLNMEFPVLVGLGFALHIPSYDIQPHYQKLLYDA